VKIRRLEAGADGMAEVLLLTEPIPRHVSLVDWGANDAPAVSWKTANPTAAHLVLRSPPSGKVASALTVDGPTLREFVGETLDAWMACVDSVLASSLQAGDRAAQIQALTVQAGARIAAALKILGPAAAAAAAAHKSAGLKVPEVPTATTLEGEIDRRRLRAAMEAASAFLIDVSLEAAKLTSGATEAVLSAFSQVAGVFCKATSSLPAGVVGAATSKSSPRSENLMTLANLQALAAEDPVGFLKTIRAAVEAAKKSGDDGVKVAQKFMWGETGVDPYDPSGILSSLVGFQDGTALQGAIASAVGGIDANKATGAGMTVAATMRKALRSLILADIKAEPEGEFAIAIKTLVAEDVATTVVETLRRAMDGGHLGGGGGGAMDWEPEQGTELDLTPDLPGVR
jgi:hypothetical protein